MKKYLLVLLLIVFIIPSVALASWWDPFSWFNGWNFNKTEITTENPLQKITVPVTTTTNDVPSKVTIPTVSTKQNNFPIAEKTIPQKNTTQPKQVPQVVPPVVTTPQQPIDICLNIEGIQTSVPAGMILQNGNCSTPIPVIPLPISVDLRINSANSITDTSATLRANLISGAPANVSFTYNEENSDSNKTTPIVYQFNNENFSAQISGLKPNTTYEFYASAYNGSSDIESDVMSFTTQLAPGTCLMGQSWNNSSNSCITTPICPKKGQIWNGSACAVPVCCSA